MALREELKAYMARWDIVEKTIHEERKAASYEIRWRQLNSTYAMGKLLGFHLEDSDESGVIERWAKLKSQHPKM